MLKVPALTNPRNPTRLGSAIGLAALLATLSACGGASFERTAGSKKYRALPRGTPVKVVDDVAGLKGPTEEIGTMKATTKGKDADVEKASANFKATAAKFGCDAVVGMKSEQREIKKFRTVTKMGPGGVRRKEKIETVKYEHDWSAKCVRSAEAPKEVPRTRRRRRGRRAASSTASTTATTPATATPAAATASKPEPKPEPKPAAAASAPAASASSSSASAAATTAPVAPRPPSGDAKKASEVARAFLTFSKYIASGNVNMLCKMLDTERIYFDIRTKSPKLEVKVDLGPEAACASLRTGDLGTYLRDFGPAEVHTEIPTLVPSLFRIHGGAYLKLDAAQEASYSSKLNAQRAGRKPLACTMYTVLPAGNLFKVSVKCEGVNSYRLLLRRDGADDFKLMAMTHIR